MPSKYRPHLPAVNFIYFLSFLFFSLLSVLSPKSRLQAVTGFTAAAGSGERTW